LSQFDYSARQRSGKAGIVFSPTRPCVCQSNCTRQKRSSATSETARDADIGAHSLSLSSNLRPVYNRHPLNSPTSIKFTYVLLIYQY